MKQPDTKDLHVCQCLSVLGVSLTHSLISDLQGDLLSPRERSQAIVNFLLCVFNIELLFLGLL